MFVLFVLHLGPLFLDLVAYPQVALGISIDFQMETLSIALGPLVMQLGVKHDICPSCEEDCKDGHP